MSRYLVQDKDSFPIETGVYSITFSNSQSGKFYIGSAAKTNNKHYMGFKGRWIRHLNALRRGDHYSRQLQFAFNKYGEENLVFQVLQVCDAADCLIYEDVYLKKFDAVVKGYNTKPLATSCLGHKSSPETIEKLKNRHKKNREPFVERVTSLYGSGISIHKIVDELGISTSMIESILDDNNIPRRKIGEARKRKIYGYDSEGKYIGQWDCAKNCAKDLNLKSVCTISHIASGRFKSYKGYKFSYEAPIFPEIA